METRCIWESVQLRLSFLSLCPVRAGEWKSLRFAGWCWEQAGLEADNWYLLVLSARRCGWGCLWHVWMAMPLLLLPKPTLL